MRIIVQRVKEAQVSVDNEIIGQIGKGFLLYVGVTSSDNEETVTYMARKIANMRIFADQEGKTNVNIYDVGGEILSISQFTLYARTKKGNRPSFIDAADPEWGDRLYSRLNELLREDHQLTVQTGQFGADMQIFAINDGPFTIILDSDEL